MHTSKHLNVYEEAQTFMRNFVLKKFKQFVNKEIFHAFLFNIRNYSPEVRNIQRREMKLNITLPRVNNLNIKQKWHGTFAYYIAQAPNKKWMNVNKAKNIPVTT